MQFAYLWDDAFEMQTMQEKREHYNLAKINCLKKLFISQFSCYGYFDIRIKDFSTRRIPPAEYAESNFLLRDLKRVNMSFSASHNLSTLSALRIFQVIKCPLCLRSQI